MFFRWSCSKFIWFKTINFDSIGSQIYWLISSDPKQSNLISEYLFHSIIAFIPPSPSMHYVAIQVEILKVCKSKGLVFAQFWSKSENYIASHCNGYHHHCHLVEWWAFSTFATLTVAFETLLMMYINEIRRQWKSWDPEFDVEFRSGKSKLILNQTVSIIVWTYCLDMSGYRCPFAMHQ